MTVRRLTPARRDTPVDTRSLPQCDEPVYSSPDWRDTRGYGPRCVRKAHVTIDGKNYCELHGGRHALRILLDQNKENSNAPKEKDG